MNYWRMAFKDSKNGKSMFDDCRRLGVAAITYKPVEDIDLSNPDFEDLPEWKQLRGSQRSSLRSVARGMRPGDVIFVKDSTQIVERGIVTGPYHFDCERRILDRFGDYWTHQIPVLWSSTFIPRRLLLGKSQIHTVEKLAEEEVRRAGLQWDFLQLPEESTGKSSASEQWQQLGEGAYVRESPERRQFIVRAHNALSNQFCNWLKETHGVVADQEKNCVDIVFDYRALRILAELKTCLGTGTRHAIRDALGQLLEYNYYPGRVTSNHWLLVLDSKPSESDLAYIGSLRDNLSFPLAIGWQEENHFKFFPEWFGSPPPFSA